MIASLQLLPPNSHMLRLHEEGGFGSPWSWGAVVTIDPLDSRCAIIEGAPLPLPPDGKLAIGESLRTAGFLFVRWTRRKDGIEHPTRKFDLYSHHLPL